MEGEKINMKTVMTVFLLLVSTPLLAERPECSYTPGACAGGVPSNKNLFVPSPSTLAASILEPSTLALLGLGVAGLAIGRRRKK